MSNRRIRIHTAAAACAALLLLAPGIASAEDWPEWRGAGREGVWSEDGIIDRFPVDGLQVKWRTPVNGGFAGPVVADGRVFVLDFDFLPETRVMDGTERILALDEETGEVLWTHAWETAYRNLQLSYATGPRAAPTVAGEHVYVQGGAGMLLCLRADTGEVVWQHDTVAEYDTTVPVWGTSSSPLVDGDRVIALIGGEPDALIAAFDAATGEEVWRAIDVVSEMGYAQPIILEAGGVRQLIVWHPVGVSSLSPETGEIYWEQGWDSPSAITVATPVRSDNYLFFSQFYGGSLMLRLETDRPGATSLWEIAGSGEMPDQTAALHSLITTPILEGDYIYGVDSYGELRGLDATTGDRLWVSDQMTVQRRWGAAFMVRHGDRYFVNNDAGDLIIAQFTPEGYIELDRTKLIEATSRAGYGPRRFEDRAVNWTHPAYANRHIVTRNDNEIIRVSLAADDY
ncbi:MAG: PQQ-like beta-propeller repeat protein [Acidobacteria bacterium]|nr:PQQ-like beta-propeller repeat protein [Acidobacteriota bacterium]